MEQVSFRLSEAEKAHLEAFCDLTDRKKTDVVRQLIRQLHVPGKLQKIDLVITIGPQEDTDFLGDQSG